MSWSLTEAERRQIRAVQRSMLRRFAAPRKHSDEEWVTWIRKATKIATNNAELAGVRCWVQEHLMAKWRWASHIARMATCRPESWAYRATVWRGSKWHDETKADGFLYNLRPLRSRAGRFSRSENEVATFCTSWTELASDKAWWQANAKSFACWS